MNTTELKETERAAFEAWARPSGFDLRRNEILGHYASLDTTRAWEGWQARAALAQQDAHEVPHLKKLLHAMHQESNAKHNLNEWLRASPAFAQRAAQAEAEWVVAVKHLVAVQVGAQKYVEESTTPTPPGACEPLTDEQTHEAIPLNQDGHPQVEPTIAKMDALASAAGIPSWSLLKRKAELHATSSRVTPTAQQDAQAVAHEQISDGEFDADKRLMELADKIDYEQNWRLSGIDQRDKLTQEQQDRVTAGVMLRRYADLMAPDSWRLFPPKHLSGGLHCFRAATLEKAVEMASRHLRLNAAPTPPAQSVVPLANDYPKPHQPAAEGAQPAEAFKLNPSDVSVEVWTSKPLNGFALGIPKGIKLTHMPTGLFVTCDKARSMHANRDKAWTQLEQKVAAFRAPSRAGMSGNPTPPAQQDAQLDVHPGSQEELRQWQRDGSPVPPGWPELLGNFKEGQWWVVELDAMARASTATDDQRRAVSVVHHLLASVAAAAPPSASAWENNGMNIIIYTKNGCPNCDSAKQLLAAKSLPYTAHNVETMEGLTAFVPAREKYPTIRQMPAIIINDQYVGGLAGLQAALKQLNL